MTANMTLRLMEVKISLIDSELTKLLSKFNKHRKNLLVFNYFDATFHFSSVMNWFIDHY